ncbi:MAG: GNAT family N-acetyltransferase [Anaerolineae bacterium]|nr:GNAT family N-acetyltransferase [Anaerolineae bacterium]
MTVERFTADDAGWPAYVAHLRRIEQARWVVTEGGQPLDDLYFLGVVIDDEVVGNISLKRQSIIIPATEWTGGQDTPLNGPDGEPLQELFVQTFAVEAAYRRHGYGRALQLAALVLTRELGCHQLRSWSSLDKPANYALKLSLGFAVHPAISPTSAGYDVSGVYFIKAV